MSAGPWSGEGCSSCVTILVCRSAGQIFIPVRPVWRHGAGKAHLPDWTKPTTYSAKSSCDYAAERWRNPVGSARISGHCPGNRSTVQFVPCRCEIQANWGKQVGILEGKV